MDEIHVNRISAMVTGQILIIIKHSSGIKATKKAIDQKE